MVISEWFNDLMSAFVIPADSKYIPASRGNVDRIVHRVSEGCSTKD